MANSSTPGSHQYQFPPQLVRPRARDHICLNVASNESCQQPGRKNGRLSNFASQRLSSLPSGNEASSQADRALHASIAPACFLLADHAPRKQSKVTTEPWLSKSKVHISQNLEGSGPNSRKRLPHLAWHLKTILHINMLTIGHAMAGHARPSHHCFPAHHGSSSKRWHVTHFRRSGQMHLQETIHESKQLQLTTRRDIACETPYCKHLSSVSPYLRPERPGNRAKTSASPAAMSELRTQQTCIKRKKM